MGKLFNAKLRIKNLALYSIWEADNFECKPKRLKRLTFDIVFAVLMAEKLHHRRPNKHHLVKIWGRDFFYYGERSK